MFLINFHNTFIVIFQTKSNINDYIRMYKKLTDLEFYKNLCYLIINVLLELA